MQVFISYNTPDHAAAEALKSAIERAHAGAKVFFAPYNLKLGAFWLPQLGEAIAASDAFLILLGKGLGEWQKLEYYEAINRHLTAKKAGAVDYPVVPVITAERAPNLPFLHQLHWVATSEPTAPEPIGQIVAGLEGEEIAAATAPWQTINPYRGLVALNEEDADFFFGRETETVEILKAIAGRQDKLICLIGNSGVGKSSLVQAGVISALKRQHMPGNGGDWPDRLNSSRAWAYVTMKPGGNPIRALASAFISQWFEDPTDPLRGERTDGWEERLNGKGRLSELVDATRGRWKELGIEPPQRVFLYVDQGEELYARGTRETIGRFSELLADGLSDDRLIVMASQRSDYYGHLQNNEALFPDRTQCIDVPPLRATSLKMLLREPARVLGAEIEPDNLVDFLVESTLGRQRDDETLQSTANIETKWQQKISGSAALPLLADFMTELWSRMQERGDGALRLSDKNEIVQVGASLARRADRFLVEHEEARDAIRRLFTLKLALVQDAGEPIRRRVLKSECSREEWMLVEELANPEWRLLVTGAEDGEPTAEIAHEVLLREWPTLTRWLNDEHDFLVWKGNLEHDRKEYEHALEQQNDALLMGLSLTKAESWYRTRSREDIGTANADFIKISLDEKERVEREKQEELDKNTRRQTYRRVALFTLPIFVFFVAFAYNALTSIHDGDVAAVNGVPQLVQGLGIKPGDIFAVGRDGSDPEVICSTDNDSEVFEVESTNAVYVNRLAEKLNTLIASQSPKFGAYGGTSVRFAGNVVREQPGRRAVSKDCSCEIARRMARKELVCGVSAAIVATGSEYAYAVRLHRYSYLVLPKKFEECGLKPISLDVIGRCDQIGKVAWDVSVRRVLNIVEQRELSR